MKYRVQPLQPTTALGTAAGEGAAAALWRRPAAVAAAVADISVCRSDGARKGC